MSRVSCTARVHVHKVFCGVCVYLVRTDCECYACGVATRVLAKIY